MRLPPARATLTIVAITGLAWAIAAVTGQGERLAPLAGFIPARISEHVAIAQAAPVWVTPLTATLIHAGLIHVGFNLLIIGFCGRFVEAAIGPIATILLYLIGAYAAAALQYGWDPHGVVPMIGASGAGSAIIGAYALLYGQRRAQGWGPVPGIALHILWLAAAWIGLQTLLGMASIGVPGVPAGGSIATPAHVGGFLAGLLLARPLLLIRYRGA
jgi:membrane associated rhomboid family serine protease